MGTRVGDKTRGRLGRRDSWAKIFKIGGKALALPIAKSEQSCISLITFLIVKVHKRL